MALWRTGLPISAIDAMDRDGVGRQRRMAFQPTRGCRLCPPRRVIGPVPARHARQRKPDRHSAFVERRTVTAHRLTARDHSGEATAVVRRVLRDPHYTLTSVEAANIFAVVESAAAHRVLALLAAMLRAA